MHAAEISTRCDTVVTVYDVRRAYFYADEDRITYVELPDFVSGEVRATHVGRLRKALYGTRPAAASWARELQKGLRMCGLVVGALSGCSFRSRCGRVAGVVHGDDIFMAGPRGMVAKIGEQLKQRWGNA